MIAQLTNYDDITRWTENVHTLIAELKKMKNDGVTIAQEGTPRIMLAGSPVIWPNWKIPDIIEESNAEIIVSISNSYFIFGFCITF